ncbi:heavy metal-associated isoprenylated plant protein 43 isoform X1 [Cryptomeria japonica]|uniref:heavy metal-associated isoprenylated plant protein 43 isoform X1 n=2 Tax=Cryptomeria japonica TaxID=3369 RepID=UPI0025ACDB95|nr:heavy metal-associated isoprenylated plant protein 43 isoform X1 [Cryptomeria japonica]
MKNSTVVSVEISCCKCKKKVMKIAADIPGVESIKVDGSTNTLTVIGEVDPVQVTTKIRKFKKRAQIISVGPPKSEEKDKDKDGEKNKEDDKLPISCPRCNVWIVQDISAFDSNPCSIM